MRAVIMAGGEGTRIRSIARTHPKSMVRLVDRPVLYYQLISLRDSGITDITIVTGRMGEEISEYFGDGDELGLSISYYPEPYPLGTGGALFKLKDTLSHDFLLLMGDLVLSVDFRKMIDAHLLSPALITLLVHPNSHPFDSDIIVTDEAGCIEEYSKSRCGKDVPIEAGVRPLSVPVTGFIGKNENRPRYYHNLVNSGIYMISSKALKLLPEPEEGQKTDIDRDVLRPLIKKGAVYAYRSSEYVKDMGTPERFAEAEDALKSGIVEQKNLKYPQRCVFIDRDGTLNEKKGFIKNPEDISLLPGAAEAIRRLNASGYLAILVTNQPVIARGEADWDRYDEISMALETALGAKGAYLDAAYFCPHHPDSGYEGELRELKFSCNCRKPAPGLILKAALEKNIDLSLSFMIGDSASDIIAGKRAGAATIGLSSGDAVSCESEPAAPNLFAPDLLSAVDIILGDHAPCFELLMSRDLRSMEKEGDTEHGDIEILVEEDTEDGECFIRGRAFSKGSELGFRMYKKQACIYGVLTYDSFLRKGYAFTLIKRVLAFLREQGIEEAVLNVSDTNTAALSLYRSLGFKVKERVLTKS